ncbi:hypothetical protein ACFFF5_02905 [Lederbergia wuyishanensis]|uniref:Signal transduction histidine kinase n=1 Tax=Lederbergia wuyishanensis TaxID=1347903 RepID=A0ABU0D0B9_9BACI|nr:hypothetical protein [Lederbergia wuyishanensis]MCJ8006469.1 hypothetical protein [Lederbergia wuyishanensis]MDQ0341845.1 signal transduction histidine kinase [Lederbergia wuyishanensis]
MNDKFLGKGWISYLLVMLLGIITSGIGLVLWFFLKDTLMIILLYYSIDKWKVPAADQFSFLILGILWMVFVFIVFHFYNKGKQNGQLLQLFLIITGCQSLLLFICESIMIILDKGKLSNIYLLISEFLIGSIFISCSLFIKTKRKNHKVSAKF